MKLAEYRIAKKCHLYTLSTMINIFHDKTLLMGNLFEKSLFPAQLNMAKLFYYAVETAVITSGAFDMIPYRKLQTIEA